MLLDRDFIRSAQPACEQPKLTIVKSQPEPAPQALPNPLDDFKIAYSYVKSPVEADDKILDRVLSPGQMSLRQLREEMGIHFQLV